MSSRGPCTSLVSAALLLACAAALSCSPDLRGTLADFQLLVFPGEAELGGSAAAVIDSNYIPGADQYEDYVLERSRVDVDIKDASGVKWPATVRAVMPLAASPASRLAQTRPGAWATVVLFNLPTDADIDLDPGPPYQADVIISIDAVEQTDDEAIGSIVITGRGGAGIGGQPTSILWSGGLSSFELDDVVMRFLPLRDPGGQTGEGFPDEPGGTVIGGIEADLVYLIPCYKDPEPFTGSEATDAGVYLGPAEVLGVGGGYYKIQHMVITHPEGFTLQAPAGGVAEALGEGPLFDLTFDRPNQSVFDCDAFTLPSVFLWNVYAVRPDGSTIADQRGSGGTLGESSDLFELRFLGP